ncbi:MAG: hypothetical protein L0Y71_16840 [Gemmataceae bacterium]|nr:hypothetical protein [Gemmataceae bacterium]
MKSSPIVAVLSLGVVCAGFGFAQDNGKIYKATVKDGVTTANEVMLPVDPQIRITPAHANGPQFGLTVEGKRITCSQNGSIWQQTRVDGQENQVPFGMGNVPQALPDGPFHKKRHGFQTSWSANGVEFTMIVEVVPSRPYVKAQPGQKRRLDTCRISYIAENKDSRPHTVEFRTNIDILVVNNDGALYASPTTEPGKVLNGVVLKDDKLPEYVLVLERPDAQNPGFAPAITLKFGKSQNVDGPSRIVLTNLGVIGQGGWDAPAQPAGDSACALYWAPKELQPKQKRTMVWAYGGGIATSPESEGRVTLAFKGPFAPNKPFTITAYVDDPSPSQSLALQLPPGMESVDGRDIRPVPPPGATGTSVVEWRARLLRAGDFELKVRSSTGVTQSKILSIQAVN